MYTAKSVSCTLLQYCSTYPFHSSSTLDQPKKGQALETQNVNLKQARHPTLDTAGNTGKYRVRFHAPLTSPHHWLPLNLVRKHDGLLDVLHRPPPKSPHCPPLATDQLVAHGTLLLVVSSLPPFLLLHPILHPLSFSLSPPHLQSISRSFSAATAFSYAEHRSPNF